MLPARIYMQRVRKKHKIYRGLAGETLFKNSFLQLPAKKRQAEFGNGADFAVFVLTLGGGCTTLTPFNVVLFKLDLK